MRWPADIRGCTQLPVCMTEWLSDRFTRAVLLSDIDLLRTAATAFVFSSTGGRRPLLQTETQKERESLQSSMIV